ncbi:hypothetical protein SAMN03159463_05580 [Mesorhizobium sp. NFR06]|uniref:hypothetical protein n=1 Tax=Mesorhizobium sp. NFR06 TaxID=1566290 RepID=UPI0008ED7E1B|nr:hypothetical protein [Mesorhizobium sp. NFR06]SFQ07873.1 hypothetical protein SAMN03159463_05580 [Mesorhizobium sp. NFR06]
MSPNERTPAADRSQIQAGRTQDKTPGFDPAVAPQETDAEAAGFPSFSAPATRNEPYFTNQASFANAMRPPKDEPDLQPRSSGLMLAIMALVVLAAVVFLLAAALP